ncbi:MAG: hypothetical protein HY331_15055 [Chloroflexi bacterium]|nr:hypothetical protein [Chloroflexota bacterium]
MLALSLLLPAVRALSLFNTIALLWLGLAVLLNAERRSWETWAAGGGALLGALFFAGHTAVVGRNPGDFGAELEFWWRASWLPFIGAPYFWYLVMAAYTGLLHAGRQRVWLVASSGWGLAALALLVFANPLPSFGDLAAGSPATALPPGGIPLLMLIYPGYSVLCIALSLAALRQPAPSDRFMGEIARQRARPWLAAATVVLLGVALAAGSVAAWFLNSVRIGQVELYSPGALALLLSFDLVISGLIAAVVVLMGRAIVTYEVFTGKVLPRRGLFRHWRSSLVLAAGYGALVGASLDVPVDPIYRLLLATVLMTGFYALISWRSYAERERSIDRLRPFVASQRLYERLLHPADPLDLDAAVPFRALCEDVLGARLAYLAALGPMASLAGPALVFPNGTAPAPSARAALADRLRASHTICLPVDPAAYGGSVWAVPLWAERGLIGVLLLGERRDGGLYAQEEIEIARAAGERLIDTQAGAELARRLMALQRRRLAESQVVDRRARRILHDDVLPRLHAALLALSTAPGLVAGTPPGGAQGVEGAGQGAADAAAAGGHRQGTGEALSEGVALLAEVHRQIADLLRAMPAPVAPDLARFGLVGALRQVVEGEMAADFDGVSWQVEPGVERRAKDLPALSVEVLFSAAREVMRNAARHGRGGDPARPLHLTIAVAWRDGIEIAVEDDGVGLGGAGMPTAGSGQGLVLHGTMMAVIGGTLTTESVPGKRTRVVLTLPD